MVNELTVADFKTCSSCEMEKPLAEFYMHGGRSPGLRRPDCKECRKKAIKSYKQTARGRELHAWSRIKHLYGITQERYEEMLAAQGGCCAICKTDDPSPHTRFSVDHDHSCCPGERSCGACVRGLLCLRCNNNLGWLEKLGSQVTSYLEAYRAAF